MQVDALYTIAEQLSELVRYLNEIPIVAYGVDRKERRGMGK
jgi:hypothetical protein